MVVLNSSIDVKYLYRNYRIIYMINNSYTNICSSITIINATIDNSYGDYKKGDCNSMKKILSCRRTIMIVSIVGMFIAAIIYSCTFFNSKADASNETNSESKRDTKLEVDSSGKLNIKRNELGNTPMGKDNWTLLVYMCGSNLEEGAGFATEEIKEMIAANESDNVNIIVQTGGSSEWNESLEITSGTNRYQVKNDSIELLEEVYTPYASDLGMADGETLSEFVQWGVDKYPAEHMGLIIWNHGGGSIKGACNDMNTGGALLMREMEYALMQGTSKITDKFEFIGFDACLMGCVETANLMVPYADYFIGSEEIEHAKGWNYTTIVNSLVDNSDMTGDEIGKIIVDSFMEATNDIEYLQTLSLIDLNKLDEVLISFNDFAKEMYNKYSSMEDMIAIKKKVAELKQYGGNFKLYDLGSFVDKFDDISCKSNVLEALNNVVLYKKNNLENQIVSGLSIYINTSFMEVDEINIYRNLAVSPYWMNFIEKTLYVYIYNSVDNFESNNWENNIGYFEKSNENVKIDEDFVAYDDYEDYESEEPFSQTDFIYKWVKWYTDYDEMDNSNKKSNNESSNNVNVSFVNISESKRILLSDSNKLTNNLKESELKQMSEASYYFVENNGDIFISLGKIGDAKDNIQLDEKWFALGDGQLLEANLIEEGNGLKKYSSPILLNNVETNIYFVADSKKNVLIKGMDSGQDKNTGMAGRFIEKIPDNANIKPIYSQINKKTGKVTQIYGKEYNINSNIIESIETSNCSVVFKTVEGFSKVEFSDVE